MTNEKDKYQLQDPTAFTHNMSKVMESLTNIANQLNAEYDQKQGSPKTDGPSNEQMTKTIGEVAHSYLSQPEKLANAQMQLAQQYGALWQASWQRFLGQPSEPVVRPQQTDKRFKNPEWEENQAFDFLKQSYLITAQWAQDMVAQADEVDDRTRQRARFYVEQVANALSPTNFALTNPEVLELTMSSNGENLVNGLNNLARDLKGGGGELSIKQTDLTAFEVGKNLALSPGKVVFQNDIIQLIQYEPTTKTVYQRPLLIIPPWINKFYILDLNPKKSFIKWAVEQGLTVFIVSWVNPDKRLAQKTFDDYMNEGILAATDAIKTETGEEKVNAIGYCIGGTLLATTLGVLAARGDERIASATFFTTQVDFEKAGDLLVFADEEQIANVELDMSKKGYLEGKKMANAFNMLRSNDLIWSYVVNNYLKGKEPMPFDLLYWNADATRMPANVHSFYLRECYLHNNMTQKKITLGGETVDLSKVNIPIYNLAAREDHIAPLPSVSRIGQFFGGKTRLVVSGSGHIAGVVNPPEANKYQYWTNDKSPENLDDWFATAIETPGSWWPDWEKWISKKSGKKIAARKAGSGGLGVIEDAPGSYVSVRSV